MYSGNSCVVFAVILTLIALSTPVVAEVIINEVMYDPNQCADSKCEWIELYNPSNLSHNLAGCTIDEKPINFSISNGSYLIVARNELAFSQNFSSTVPVTQVAISLVNAGEPIHLNCPDFSNIFDYSPYITHANGDGHTLERRSDGSWAQSLSQGGTPGKQNSIHDLAVTYQDIIITEFLPDPEGNDDEQKPRGEWVELYNKGNNAIDISPLVLYDNNDEHELYITDVNTNTASTILGPEEYLVVYRNQDSDFSLNNVGSDKVRLAFEDQVIDEVSYAQSTSAMSWAYINGEWWQVKPTLAQENEYHESCDWQIEVSSTNPFTIPDEPEFVVTVKRNYGFAQRVSATGIIEDEHQKEVKSYAPWTNEAITTSRTKTYTPNLQKGVYLATFQISELDCEDDNLENNKATLLLATTPEYAKKTNSIEIENVYLGSDAKAKWGDQITVRLQIYKGEDDRKALYLRAKQDGALVSKTTQINVEDEFRSYEAVVPLQLQPNCNARYDDGSITLELEGLGESDHTTFLVEGQSEDICEEWTSYEKNQTLSVVATAPLKVQEAQIESEPQETPEPAKSTAIGTGLVVYEGNAAKAQRLAPTLLLIGFALLSLALLIDRRKA